MLNPAAWNRLRRTVIFLITVILVFTCIPSKASSPEGDFQHNYEAIDVAADSVLMLYMYEDGKKDNTATASGFVAFNNRTIITNYHVIEGVDSIVASNDNDDVYLIDKIYAADKEKDIAILGFMSPTDMKPLTLNENEKLMRGQPVVAIGSPKGLKNTVSTGIISSIIHEEQRTIIQTTAPISHGSSGGALFNDNGVVIGITTSGNEDGQNINFAIDVREAIELYNYNVNSKGILLDEYDGQNLGTKATPTPTVPPVTPTPIPISKIYDLTLTQTGPDAFKAEWKESSEGSFTYYCSAN